MENTKENLADKFLEKIRNGDEKAFRRLQKLADEGNAQAISNLAGVYLKGHGGFENSYKKALELFNEAATLNDPRALFCLGTFYRDAKYGFEQDGQKAAEYFIRGAQHAIIPEDVFHFLNLAAEIYRYGKGGVTPDAQKAIELYEKLAKLESRGEAKPELTSEKALFKLAEIYTEGCGNLKPDAQKAVEYLNEAHNECDPLGASYELAKFYREGKAGLKPDGYKVIEYLSKLPFRHMKTIAEIYRDGKYNVKADGYKAIEYFIKKSELETEVNTLEELEIYFITDLDYDEYNDAEGYCSEAKEICNVDVFQEIAKIYLEGKGGVQPDGYKALEYFSKAAEGINYIINFTKKSIEDNSEIKKEQPCFLNSIFYQLGRINKNISEQIAEIYSEGKGGVQPDGQNAIEYLLNAIEAERDNPVENSRSNNISNIYNKIACIYLEGCGNVQTDGYKAIDYFERSSNFEKIAEIYRYGKACVKPAPQKAIEYFLKYEAAKRPVSDDEMSDFDIFLDNLLRANVFRNVAEIYSSLNNGQKALEYFIKADELGDECAYLGVAIIYSEGKGNLKPDGVKFIEYLTKKLEQGESQNDIILYEIAKAYEEGCGSLEPNTKKALEFYRKSAALGNDLAKKELAIRKLL